MLVLRRTLFEHFLHLPLPKLWDMKTGGILSRLTGDVDTTTGLLQMAVFSPSISVVRLIIAMAVLGFPLVCGLAWALDLTPQGIERMGATQPEPASNTAGMGNASSLPAEFPAAPAHTPTAVPAESVAILPFADMSPAHDQEYFCDGIAEEIINALCCVRSLRVASRTSSFQFKGRSADVGEIGRQLRV